MKRQWLYKKNVEPTIFTGEEAINDALDSGWKDTPAGFDKSKDVIDAKVVEKKKKSTPAIEAKAIKPTKKDKKLEEVDEIKSSIEKG